MSIENSFCLCNWNNTVHLWRESSSEDSFAEAFFSADGTKEIEFPDRVRRHLTSWDILEDFSDWYRERTFTESEQWEHFCAACKQLGLMETKEFHFQPINELVKADDSAEPTEIVFGALPPSSVGDVLQHLKAIDGQELDQFFQKHELSVSVPFSEMVKAMIEALDPSKGLVIFAG